MKAGGLGLGCAATTMEPAYIAGWVDFLHFIGANAEVFPAVTPLVTPTALESSPLYAIYALRQAWQYMDVTRLARRSVDEPPRARCGQRPRFSAYGQVKFARGHCLFLPVSVVGLCQLAGELP